MVDNAYMGPPFAAWYLLGSIFDNPNAVCLTPGYVEGVLRHVGFDVDGTDIMLPGITMLTRATKPA
jgi:2-hydroxy-4-(methylsulfanyl)butanoate S-methyltransferase